MSRIETQPLAELHFPLGLPGFAALKRFTLIERPEATPLLFLQSLDCPGLSFVTAPVQQIDPAYQLELTTDDLQQLGLALDRQPKLNDVTCLAILSAPDDGQPTANLLAPVVIDPVSKRGVQSVRTDSRYSHQFALGSVMGPVINPMTRAAEPPCS
jgi:flagellar assembly factor FliW